MEDLLWYSPLFFPSTRAHWGLPDVRGTSRFRVIDLIYIVYALHVTTFFDVSRWGDAPDITWVDDDVIRGCLAYFFCSGWMLPSAHSTHPDWPAARSQAARAAEHAWAALWTHQYQSRIFSAIHSAQRPWDRDRALLLGNVLEGLVSAGEQLFLCGARLHCCWTCRQQVAPLRYPSKRLRRRTAHPDAIMSRLRDTIAQLRPPFETYTQAFFAISCELAIQHSREFDISVVDMYVDRLIMLTRQ